MSLKRKGGTAELPAAKKPATLDADGEAAIQKLQEIQKSLSTIDDECAKEQLKVQRQFSEKMRPLFDERQKLAKSIPKFWSTVFTSFPLLFAHISKEDAEILQLLDKIDVDDNIDDRGSYSISFTFEDEAKKFFSPLVITKKVVFSEAEEEEPKVECTKISWVAGKSPIEAARARNKKVAAEGEDEDEDESLMSIFEWFSDDNTYEGPEVGEIIRRELWHNPLPYFFGDDDEEDEEDEEGDEEDEEDGDA